MSLGHEIYKNNNNWVFGPETYKLWLMNVGLLFLNYSFSRVLQVLKCIDISVMKKGGITFFLKLYLLKQVTGPVIYNVLLMMVGVYYFSN